MATVTTRRALLRSLASLGGAGALGATLGTPAIVHARQRRGGAASGTTDAQHAFASSFEDFAESRGPLRVRFDRPLPRGLAGTLYRNGPARMQRGATRYRHWFDGDGMINAFRLEGDSLVHRARMVRTGRYEAEEQAGRFMRGGFGTAFADALPVGRPDDLNVANISVLPLGGDLLALWEAGSAWRIDPSTLATRGRKVFSPDTDGLSFSAHPRVDPDGRVWNFGYLSGSGKLALYDIDRSGKLNRATLIDAPNAEMVHDFAITRRFLVFVLMPITWDRREQSRSRAFVQRLGWNGEGQVDVLLVDKSTLEVAHRFTLPPFFAFHFGNAWEDGDTVRVEVARAPAFDLLMRSIEAATLGEVQAAPFAPLALEAAAELRLDLRAKTARLEDLPVRGGDFPRFDARFTGLPTTRLLLAHRSDAMPAQAFGFNGFVSIDRRRGRLQQWDYGAHAIAEEHLFAPRPGAAEGVGWVLGTHYDWHTRRTGLAVFDAQRVEEGPIAQAALPYRLPLGLHGQFVAAG